MFIISPLSLVSIGKFLKRTNISSSFNPCDKLNSFIYFMGGYSELTDLEQFATLS